MWLSKPYVEISKMTRFIVSSILIIACNFSHLQASEIIDISKYKDKVVYLDFWASWCEPCRESFPWLNKIRQQYPQEQLAIIAVNLDKERKLATEFLKKVPANFEIVYDPKGELAQKYQIQGMPSSILFGGDGKPIKAHTGFFNKNIGEYEEQLKVAINQLSQE